MMDFGRRDPPASSRSPGETDSSVQLHFSWRRNDRGGFWLSGLFPKVAEVISVYPVSCVLPVTVGLVQSLAPPSVFLPPVPNLWF